MRTKLEYLKERKERNLDKLNAAVAEQRWGAAKTIINTICIVDANIRQHERDLRERAA